MLNYFQVCIGTGAWMILSLVFLLIIRSNSETLDIKHTRRRCLVFSRAVLIFFYSGYLIVMQDIYGDNDPENETIIRYIVLTFYIFDLLSLAFYLKSNDASLLIHHIISIGIVGGLTHYKVVPYFFKYELMNVELSIIFQSPKDALKSLDRGKTKAVMILEFGFIVSFVLSKIIIRTFLLYINVFFLEVHYLFKAQALAIQILYYFWGWKLYFTVKEKQKQGYFNWKDFESYPWIIISEKKD